jgi:3-deoxy-D-manno-octulosonate 8-phosphate phosphatase (KDO 8-P phosphatase)
MRNLGIDLIYQGQENKLAAFADLLQRADLSPEQVAYIGDDVVDLPVMRKVGLAIAVQDAHPWVVKHAHWQTPRAGGRGAGRDVCEMLMEAHGVLQQELESYL